jgi:hypothetical protein
MFWLNPDESWWQARGLGKKSLYLGGLVIAAVVAYFGSLGLMGIRPRQLLGR